MQFVRFLILDGDLALKVTLGLPYNDEVIPQLNGDEALVWFEEPFVIFNLEGDQ